MKNYYEVLGLAEGASRAQIKKAYILLAKKYHPDSSEEENATEIFADISEAYAVLYDTEKRKEYDEQLEQYRNGINIEEEKREEKFNAYLNKAKKKIMRNNYIEAKRFLDKIYEHLKYSGREPNNEFLSYYGFILVIMDINKNEGMKLMDKAITETMFNNYSYMLNISEAYFFLKDHNRGMDYLKRALKLNPKSRRARQLFQKYGKKRNKILDFIFRRK